MIDDLKDMVNRHSKAIKQIADKIKEAKNKKPKEDDATLDGLRNLFGMK